MFVLFDSLTGQFNRSRLLDSVNERLLQTRRYHNPACYIVIGLNAYTPQIEDGNVAAAEDAILIAISQQIESSCAPATSSAASASASSASCCRQLPAGRYRGRRAKADRQVHRP